MGATNEKPDWGESKDVAQALVKREYANAAGALLGLAASLLGAPAFAIGAVSASGSMGAAWLWAKFAATSAQAKFEQWRDELDAQEEAERTAFVDRLMRESLQETHSQLRRELGTRDASILATDHARAVEDVGQALAAGIGIQLEKLQATLNLHTILLLEQRSTLHELLQRISDEKGVPVGRCAPPTAGGTAARPDATSQSGARRGGVAR